MLDRQIHKHLDEQEKLEIESEDDIDNFIKSVSIKKIIENPSEALLAIVEVVKENIKENYAKPAIQNGIDFAEDVKKSKADIKIQKTNNPQLNKDDAISKDNRQD